MNLKMLMACGALAVTFATGAHAETLSYDVYASDFVCVAGPCVGSAPYASVTEDFTVTLDPTINTGPTSVGLNVTYFTLPYSSEFTYGPGYTLTVATDPYVFNGNFAGYLDPDNSYGLFIYPPLANPFTEFFSYTDSNGSLWVATNVATTPLPSSWLMLLAGFAGLGFFAYRGSKKSGAALAAA